MSTKGNIENVCSLTPMQEGMLFHALLDKTSPAYFNQISYRIHTEFKLPLVDASLDELFKRHDALRTAFVYEGVSVPLQVVLKSRKPHFYFEDITNLGAEEIKRSYILNFRKKDIERSFDLTKEALMRVSLLQVNQGEYELIWSNHHILMDAWCVGILVEEFYQIYNALDKNQPCQLTPAPSFRDYVKWLERQDKSESKQFWKNNLAGYRGASVLPSLNNAFEKAYKTETASFYLTSTLTKAINDLTKKYQITLNSLCQTIWGVLLSRYNNSKDVVFGSVVSNRPSEIPGIESMIGLFINTVPVRVKYDSNTSFINLAMSIQDDALASERYHHYSLAEIQAENNENQPLFDHLFTFQNFPISNKEGATETAVEKPGVSKVEMFEQTNYDFQVIMASGNELVVFLQYNANVFDKILINNIFLHFNEIVNQIIDNENLKIEDLTIISKEEKQFIIEELNNTQADFPLNKTLPHYLEDFAQKEPEKIAVECNGVRLSYSELNKLVNQEANYLSKQIQLKQDDLVAIIMDRSEKILISILAVWKLNAAYIPIDPEYPSKHITNIIKNSGAKLIVTATGSLDKDLGEEFNKTAKVIYLDACKEAISQEDPLNLNRNINPSALSYVIYTSGSTGNPKGAMVEHRGMMNHVFCKIKDLQLSSESVIMQNASQCFDISIWQLFAALAVGGKTIIYDNAIVLDPERLLSQSAADGVTIMEVVPSYLSVILDLLDSDTSYDNKHLSALLVTGETVKRQLVKRWFNKFPAIKMINAYGPTEASDDITHYIMHSVPATETVPIGSALPNFKIYITDEQMNLCPIGVKGEICVSGVGVGRGYLNDKEKTDAVFTEDPFQTERGIRLYKTGDIGRFLPDGNIEFFGRKDYQVKVRGYRIELEEIETNLIKIEGVKDAAVVDKKDGRGNTILHAYVVLRDGHTLSSNQISSGLEKLLPHYMVPSGITILDALPLNSNGKLDRKALVSLETDLENIEKEYLAPGNEIERKLAVIWEDILDTKLIGIRDNFFELGGHSLKATRVISRIHKELHVKLEIKYIFSHPTIEQLALLLANSEQNKSEKIKLAEKQEIFDLSHGQKGLWMKKKFGKSFPVFNMIHYVIYDELDIEIFKKAVQSLVQRHESLRTTFVTTDNEVKQKVHPTASFHYDIEVYDLRNDAEKKQRINTLIEKTLYSYFDWEKGPLFNIKIFHLEDGNYTFVLIIDHIISDARSIEIIEHDLHELYEAHKSNTLDSISDLSVQHQDYIDWEKGITYGDKGKIHQHFWKDKLSGKIDHLKLPATPTINHTQKTMEPSHKALLKREVKEYYKDLTEQELETLYGYIFSARPLEGASYRTTLDSTLHSRLISLSHTLHCSLFAIITAALNILLYEVTKQKDIIVGTPVSVRDHEDFNGLIGWFLNTLIIRNKISPDDTISEFIKEVSAVISEALEHRAYPFEKILVDTDISSDIIGKAFVHLLNADPNDKRKITDFTSRHRPTGTPTFDINFTFHEYSNGLILICDYKPELFQKEEIGFLTEEFKNILERISFNTTTRIKDFCETCMKESFTNKNENYKQVPDDQFNTIRFSEEINEEKTLFI